MNAALRPIAAALVAASCGSAVPVEEAALLQSDYRTSLSCLEVARVAGEVGQLSGSTGGSGLAAAIAAASAEVLDETGDRLGIGGGQVEDDLAQSRATYLAGLARLDERDRPAALAGDMQGCARFLDRRPGAAR